jgi:hypothetical protein
MSSTLFYSMTDQPLGKVAQINRLIIKQNGLVAKYFFWFLKNADYIYSDAKNLSSVAYK